MVFVLFTFYIQSVLKFKCKTPVPKVKTLPARGHSVVSDSDYLSTRDWIIMNCKDVEGRAGIAYSVRGHRDRIPVEDEIFSTRPDRPWGPPSLLYNEYRFSFPGVKRPGRGVDHPPPSSAEVKERV